MATYAIGDVQGCHEPLQRLLERLRFDPAQDRVIFLGDLVNRGPQSVEVLRFVRSLGNSAVSLLGNHDLHLLALAARGEKAGRKDTLQGLLDAPDRDELLGWLSRCPLAHEDPETGVLAVHAGVAPQWTRAKALALAQEAGAVIAGAKAGEFYAHMYGDEPDQWREGLKGWKRLRFIVNCFTRIRYCDAEGRIDTRHKGAPGTQPAHLHPWFDVEGRRTASDRIIFGHWSTLGRISWSGGKAMGLDTGCVWGGQLTALNLQTGALVGCDCPAAQKPGADG